MKVGPVLPLRWLCPWYSLCTYVRNLAWLHLWFWQVFLWSNQLCFQILSFSHICMTHGWIWFELWSNEKMNYFDFFIDVEFVGQFTLPKQDPHAERHCTPIIAFLEHSIYVTYAGLREVIVFAGQAPFNKLSTIKINHLEEPYSMVGNAARNALYISDTNSESAGIWHVSLAGKLKVTHQRLGQGGTPGHLSITPNGQLLAVVERHRAMVHDGNLLYPDPNVKDPQQRFSFRDHQFGRLLAWWNSSNFCRIRNQSAVRLSCQMTTSLPATPSAAFHP